MRCGLVYLRSQLNIIPLSIRKAVGVHRDRVTKQPIEVFGFEGNSTYSLGFVNLDITVDLMPCLINT